MQPSPESATAIPTGPIAWMSRNRVAANLLMLVITAGGLLGLFRVVQEVFPEFTLETVTATVPYPGASPNEVEQGITLALEEQLRGIDGVKRVISVWSEGMATVNVELLLGADKERALNDVKSAVDRIQSFPEDAEEPNIRLASNRREVISLIVSGNQDLTVLHALAERMRSAILESPHVTQVEVAGIRPREISIEVPRATLEAYGLSLEQIAAQVRAASIELPGGEIETTRGEILVRVADRRKQGHDFADVILKGTEKGYDVRLGEIATIVDGYADTDQSLFFDGLPAARVTAYRVGDETPRGVADAVRETAERLRAELPPNVSLATWADSSEILTARMDLLVRNGYWGLGLVLLVLALFLKIRLAGWVSLGIPISFLGAFALMPAAGLSINMVTLFAFIVTLGLVVDDAIVVGENVFHKLENGQDRLTAAIEGTREMAVPVTFAVMTTVAAFAPLFFVPGVMGKIFVMIPAVVCAVLIVSLVESFFILPAHLSHGTEDRSSQGVTDRIQARVTRGLDWFSGHLFRPLLARVIRFRYMSLAAGVALLALTAGLLGSGLVPFGFFPKLEGDQVVVSARLPYGAPPEQAEVVRRNLEAAAKQAMAELGGDGFRGMVTRMGQGAPGNGPAAGAAESGSHLVNIEVGLVPTEQRKFTSADYSAAWSKRTPPLPGVEALVFNHSIGPGAGAAVGVQLSHASTDVLAASSADLTESLRGFPALTNVENDYATGKPQLDFHLLPAARPLGLTGLDVARQLRSSFFGAEALREQRGRDEVKVMARLPESERHSEDDLDRLQIRTPAGAFVPLSSVATFERSRSPTGIRREDGKRIITVSAELAPGVPSSREVIDSLEKDVFPEIRRAHPGLNLAMVGQQREQLEAFQSLRQNYLLALFAIFALLAIPFKSYVQPIIVMAAIPFGIVGAVAGHLIMGYGMSIISVFGIIALSGVVVNDSLVLIDATNTARRDGMSAHHAIVYGATRRLRPILLTSLTTFFGLAPMISETSVQARFLIPMAISLGFGVLFATVIVLLLVPALYLIVEDFLGLFSKGSKEGSAVVAE
jgi:multidrug efflux pump subunit AcrB